MLKHRRTIIAVFGLAVALAMVGNFALCFLCQDDCADVLLCSDACCHCACAVQATLPIDTRFQIQESPVGDVWMIPSQIATSDLASDLERPPKPVLV